MKKIISTAILAVLMIASSMSAAFASSVHTVTGSTLNASQCNGNGAPIVNVTFKVTNDSDSGVAGNVWANDNYNKNVQIWQESSGMYCAIVSYTGHFTTFAGVSPQNTGLVGANVTGTLDGGYLATFTGSFSPTLAVHGNLGTFDFACNGTYNCPGSFDWLSAYFTNSTSFDQSYWAWNYHAGNNGSWVNASTGNLGDITGN